MRPDNLFRMELLEDLRRKGPLALKLVLPIVLVIPLTLDRVSTTFRVDGLPLIVLFLGVLGSSVGLTRLRERGLLERMSALPVRRSKLVMDYLMANTAMDAIQIIAPFTILAISFRLHMDSLALAAVGLAVCLVLSNTLGVLVAMAAGGSGEVHLYSGICVLGVAGLSGLFFGGSSPMIDSISNILPFGVLASGLSQTATDAAVGPIIASVFATALLMALAAFGSSRLFRR